MNVSDFLFDQRTIVALMMIGVTGVIILCQEFIVGPQEAEIQKESAPYQPVCVYQKEVSIIQENPWDRIDLRTPQNQCEVQIKKIPIDNNTNGYYVQYQYDYAMKFHKQWTSIVLSCTPVGFNDSLGSFICKNGSIANETKDKDSVGYELPLYSTDSGKAIQ